MPRDIKDILGKNVATMLEKEELDQISYDAVNGYDIDEESRSEWKERNKKGMELAMQIAKKKDFPFTGAANVMYPLISISSIQFASRAYPNLIPGWDIIRGKVIGQDQDGMKADKAKRVETHMNYQLNEEIEEWEEETDRLLTVLPITGCCFKETYWSSNLKRIVSSYYSPEDIVMYYKAKSMSSVPRITKKYTLYPNEIIERIRSGLFIEFDVNPAQASKEGEEQSQNDIFKPHLFLQQNTWLDLDGDGYKEPYILNVHYDTKKVVRIVPRFRLSDITFNNRGQISLIKAKNQYTKFTFMHSPDGAIYDWGFGSLLSPINHTVNTTINQLLDAGTMNSAQTGFIGRNISLGRGKSGGTLRLEPGELMPIMYSGDDLRKNIVMLNEFMREPSAVLFNLLGFMVNAGEKLSSVTELLMGEQTIQNEPATTSLARLEQGLKVFSAIHKRLHRSFTNEFKLIYELNSEYMEPSYYFRINDDPNAEQSAFQADYDKSSCDIVMTSSPEDVSNTQKMVKAQALMAVRGQGFNDQEIGRRYIEALQIPDYQTILQAPPPQPDPKLVLESEKLDITRSQMEFDFAKFPLEIAKVYSEIIKNIADAESKEAGQQLNEYKAQADSFIKMAEANYKQTQERKNATTNQG